MYFSKNDLVDVSKLIKNDCSFFAHKKENENENLIDHINLSNKYFLKIFNEKKLENVFINFEKNYLCDLEDENLMLFRKMLLNVVNFHDIGKINPLFQSVKMKNKIKNKDKITLNEEIGSNHSMLSAILYIESFVENVDKLKKINKQSYKLMCQILFLNAYVISRHHAKLSDFCDFKDLFYTEYTVEISKMIEFLKENNEYLLEKQINLKTSSLYMKLKNVVLEFNKNSKEKNIYLYTYIKLMHSLVICSDFYATSEFMENVEINYFGNIDDIYEFYEVYKQNEIHKSIRNYEKTNYKKQNDFRFEKNINVLRSEMFLDSECELIKNINKNIFFLEAPTGSGKSNTSMNLSFKILEKDNLIQKIFYVYPFNTLIEQNINSLKNIFTKELLDKVAVINSQTPIKVEEEIIKNEENHDNLDFKYYSKALLDRQFLNYPIILTTHVSLFDILFKNSKEACFSFYQLANSVIVLDEIQSYKNSIWTEIITFLYSMSKILNLKIIIMSATLPNLSYLLDNDFEIVNLIKNREKYFLNNLFKERVTVDYSLLNKNIDDLFLSVMKNYKNNKVLVEFIKKQSAYDFYYKLKQENLNVFLLTGDDNIVERQNILEKVNLQNEIILISTQVIEAGVDIDMTIGYKDISKLDSEEQFMGRINRSCKNYGKVYFFDLDKENLIYKNDLRIQPQFTLKNDLMKEILINKNFSDYYTQVMKKLKTDFNEKLSDCNLQNFFESKLANFKFSDISERMKLIDKENYEMNVFLSRKITTKNNEVIDGRQIWESYKSLLMDNNINYSKKQVELSNIKSKLNYFIYKIPISDIPYNEKIGSIYCVYEGENYFVDNKLNKEMLIKNKF